MARIRTIKPEFWTAEQVLECSPLARLLFIGMWNFCDDRGVHPASVKTLKAEVMPADDITTSEVETLVKELVRQDLIQEFVHEDRRWWHVTGWHHQLVNRPTPSRYPTPPRHAPLPVAAARGVAMTDDTSTDVNPHGGLTEDSLNAHGGLTEDSLNAHGGLTEDSLQEGKGREGNGKERKGEEQENARAKKNGETKTYPSPALAKHAIATAMANSRFNEFWTVWVGHKTRQHECFAVWQNGLLDQIADHIIADVVRRQRDDVNWIDGYGPGPFGYLSGKRWQDDIQTKRKKTDREQREEAYQHAKHADW